MAACTALRNMTAKQRRDVYRGDMMASMARATPRSVATSERATPGTSPRSMVTSGADRRFGMPRDECAQGKHSAIDTKRKKIAKSFSATRPESPLASPSSPGSRRGDSPRSPRRLRPGEEERDTGVSPFGADSPASIFSQFSEWLPSPARCQVEPGELSPPPVWSPGEDAPPSSAETSNIGSTVAPRLEQQFYRKPADLKPNSSSSALASHLSVGSTRPGTRGQQLPGRSQWLSPGETPPAPATGSQRRHPGHMVALQAKDLPPSPGATSFDGASTTTGGFHTETPQTATWSEIDQVRRQPPSATSSLKGAPVDASTSRNVSPQAKRELGEELPSESRTMLVRPSGSYAARRAADTESVTSSQRRPARDNLANDKGGSAVNLQSSALAQAFSESPRKSYAARRALDEEAREQTGGSSGTYVERRRIDERRRRTLLELKVSKVAPKQEEMVTPREPPNNNNYLLHDQPKSYAARRALDEQGISRASIPVSTTPAQELFGHEKKYPTPGVGTYASPEKIQRNTDTPSRRMGSGSYPTGSGSYPSTPPTVQQRMLRCQSTPPRCISESGMSMGSPRRAVTNKGDRAFGHGLESTIPLAGSGLLCTNRSDTEGTHGKVDAPTNRGIRTQAEYTGGGPTVLNGAALDDDLEKTRLRSVSASPVASSPCFRQPDPDSFARSHIFESDFPHSSQRVAEAMTWSVESPVREHHNCNCALCKPFSPRGEGAGQQSMLMQHTRLPRCHTTSTLEAPRRNGTANGILIHEGQTYSAPLVQSAIVDTSDPAGNYPRNADKGKLHSVERSWAQDDSCGGIAPCMTVGSKRDTESEPPLCIQTKGSGLGSQPSPYQHTLSYRSSPLLQFHSSGRRCVSSPPQSPSFNPLTHEGAREERDPSRRRLHDNSGFSSLTGSSVQPTTYLDPLRNTPALGFDSIGFRDHHSDIRRESLESPLYHTRQKRQLNLRGTEVGQLIQQARDDAIGTPLKLGSPGGDHNREKRQDLLKGAEMGKLLQNAGYFQAIEEMRDRKTEDPKYAEQCRVVAASLKENADVAREVKRRCHPNVANVAAHLAWND